MSARSYHSGGVNFGLADGSIRFISDEVSANTYTALGSRNGARAASTPTSKHHQGETTMCFSAAWLLGLTLLTLCGCGQKGPRRYTVVGTVKWQDQLIEKGDAILEPLEATVAAEGTKIVDGHFTIRLPAGKMRK